MRIIGLCGGSGSGKGAVSDFLSGRGIPCIDLDQVYHSLTSSDSLCLRELKAEFGEEIISTDGSLDRVRLRDIVFAGGQAEKKLKKLNEITHKHVIFRAEEELSRLCLAGHSLAVVDAPLLFESGYDKKCQLTVAVLADRALRIERIRQRDGLSEEEAVQRIDSQMSDGELARRADYTVYNNGTYSELTSSCERLIKKIEMEFRDEG